MAALFVGTSGWAYAPWKGTFYPATIKPDEMLPFYAQRFNAVEINNSFYRLPAPGAVAKWSEAVPSGFRFALKAPADITHRRRLQDAEGSILRLMERMNSLGDHAGPILVQLPEDMKLDLGRLEEFLRFVMPFKHRLAFEPREDSWFVDETYAVLRRFDVALCLTETDESITPCVPASAFAYLRLRKADYSAAEISDWKRRLDDLLREGKDAYVFFKHEDTATGPTFAERLLES